jgi:putative tricarboxylic transport membrane protein
MTSALLRLTHHAVELGVAILFIAMGGLIFYDAMRLGPGWGESGPQPGFFPFVLALALTLSAIAILIIACRNPEREPFFEVFNEIEDLLKVGTPILIAVIAIPWLGLYITSGVYLGLFMALYGRFSWYSSLAGAILLPGIMWITFREGFNISMPLSVFYRMDVLPF